MRTTTFILTTDCDWNCDYCNVTRYGKYMVTKESIDRHVPYIKELINDHSYILTGGEIGLVPEDLLVYTLQSINRSVIINTNGMFLERGYHKNHNIRKYIDKIYYHVIDHPVGVTVPIYHDNNIEILNGIVGDDIDGISDFLVSNPEMKISYIGMDTCIGCEDVDYMGLYLKIKDYPNITEDALRGLEVYCLRHNHIGRYRTFCMSTNFTIDLSKEVICLCGFRNKHVDIPLTRDNLIRVTTTTNNFSDQQFSCDTCHRVCMDTDLTGNIRDILRKR